MYSEKHDDEDIVLTNIPRLDPLISSFLGEDTLDEDEVEDVVDGNIDRKPIQIQDHIDEEEDDYDEHLEEDTIASDTKDFNDSYSESLHSPYNSLSKDVTYDNMVQKFISPPETNFNRNDINDIKLCMRYLCSRAKRKYTFSIQPDGHDSGFEDARNCERLLNVMVKIARTEDKDAISNHDFETAITAWMNAAFSAYDSLLSKSTSEVLSLQRLRSTRWLYVNERAEHLFFQMEDLSRKGFPSLRPSQYSYETIISGWAKASRALNYSIRGEGKAAATRVTKLPSRRRLSKAENEKTPWRNERIMDKYSITGPATKVDQMLQRLTTMAEIDGSEFSASPWSLYAAAKAWVYVKTKPKRFYQETELHKTQLQRLKEESHIPQRAEEILWMLVDLTSEGEDEQFLEKRTKLFRDVISSWSHSNDPRGQHHAERILIKMGELYENGHLKCEPTPDIFSAVIGAWSRRSISLPFEAPARCIAILKHMEQISDGSKVADSDVEESDQSNMPKWSNFQIDERPYLTCFGAFRSALHSAKIGTVEGAFRLASESDRFLSHVKDRSKSTDLTAVKLDVFMFESVLMCYSNVINVLNESTENKDSILKDVGVDFMLLPDPLNEMELESTLIRINELVDEMEDSLLQANSSELTSNAYLPAMTAWANAFIIPNSLDEVLGILYRVLALYRGRKIDQIPTTEIFDVAINAALRANRFDEAIDILRDQESLYFDSECSPLCKPNIASYRSILVSCGEDYKKSNPILSSMTRVYETNVVEELFKNMGSTTLGFNEILQLWSELDGRNAAEWAEAFLLKIAKEAINSRAETLPAILSYQNFDATILTWCKAKRSDRAEKLLREVLRLRSHSIFSELEPPYKTFDLVIGSMISSSNKASFILKAENLLRDMTSPNLRSVNLVLRGYSQVRDSNFDTAQQARDLFLWALEVHNSPENVHMKNPCKSFQSFSSVMTAVTIKSSRVSDEVKRKNYNIALAMFKDWSKHNDIDSKSVEYIMNAAVRLLPFKERQEHISAIFKRCQQKGIVSEAIFNFFKEGSSNRVFSNLTNGLNKQTATYDQLPNDWIHCVIEYH